MDTLNVSTMPFAQRVAAFVAALRAPQPTIVASAFAAFAGGTTTAPAPDLSKTTMKALLTRSVLKGGLGKAVAIYNGMSLADRRKLQALSIMGEGLPLLAAHEAANVDDVEIFSADPDTIEANMASAVAALVDVEASPWVAK